MVLLTGRQFSARSVFRSSLGRSPPSKFGCDESALVLTTEPQWDCRETASVLLTDRPSYCGQAVAELLSVERLHSISLGTHRCLSRNIEGMTATEGRGRVNFPAENNLLSFDRGRAIRLLRSCIGVARRKPTQLFPSATDLLSLGRGAPIRLRLDCTGPAHRRLVQCQSMFRSSLGRCSKQVRTVHPAAETSSLGL